MTQWLIDFSELLAHSAPVDDARGVAVLRQARSLHANPRTPWTSVGFTWLAALQTSQSLRGRAPPERALQSLNWLLSAGLPVEGAFFSVEGMPAAAAAAATRAYYEVTRSSPQKNKKVAALYAGLPYTERNHPSLSTPWLGRTFWAGRAHPELPQLVDRWLEAGANPSDVLPSSTGQQTDHSWSSWPVALLSGRKDALERLAARGPMTRPPDWSRAVKQALLGQSERRLAVLEAVRWFVEQFPPTLEERINVAGGLNKPTDQAARSALVAWLSLPGVGLPAGEQIPGLPDGFNPWSLVLAPMVGMEEVTIELVHTLSAHPVWGTAEKLSSARVKIRLMDEQDVWVPLVEAILLQDEKGRLGGLDAAVLEAATALSIEVSPAFSTRLAHAYTAPASVATQWLLQRRAQWAGEVPGTRSPWHAGVSNGSVVDWLVKHGVSGAGIDAQGNTGWANLLGYALTQTDDRVLSTVLPLLVEQPWTGREKGWGVSASAWVASRAPGVIPLLVEKPSAFEAAGAILKTLDVKAASNLFQAPDVWRGFTREQQCALLDQWASALAPSGAQVAYLDSPQLNKVNKRAAAVLSAMVGQTTAVGLGLNLDGWISRVAQRHVLQQDSWESELQGRHDLVEAFSFMEGVAFLALPTQDRQVLARWLFVSMVTQQAVQSPPDDRHVYPWATETGRGLRSTERAALGRSFVHWLAKNRFPTGTSATPLFYTMCWGAIGALVLDGGQVLLAEGLRPEQLGPWKARLESLPEPLLRVSGAWRADVNARLIEEHLPAARPAVSKPRF